MIKYIEVKSGNNDMKQLINISSITYVDQDQDGRVKIIVNGYEIPVICTYDDVVKKINDVNGSSSDKATSNIDRFKDKPVNDLELPIRCLNSLYDVNIMTVGKLVELTQSEVLRIPNMGRKGLNYIKSELEILDLRLGMGSN